MIEIIIRGVPTSGRSTLAFVLSQVLLMAFETSGDTTPTIVVADTAGDQTKAEAIGTEMPLRQIAKRMFIDQEVLLIRTVTVTSQFDENDVARVARLTAGQALSSYAGVHHAGARTGRSRSDRPNLVNLPKDDADALAAPGDRDVLAVVTASLRKTNPDPNPGETPEQTIARQKKWINDLLSGRFVNCVYCGHRYEPASDPGASQQAILTAHVEKCPQHPLAKAAALRDKYLTACGWLSQSLLLLAATFAEQNVPLPNKPEILDAIAEARALVEDARVLWKTSEMSGG